MAILIPTAFMQKRWNDLVRLVYSLYVVAIN